MTDKQIIQSFLDNNQNGIRKAYYAWRIPFEQSVCYRTQLDPDYVDDAYQEAFIRLQQHILTERLTSNNIQSSLLSYFKEIGYFVAMEIINKRRELPVSRVAPYACDDENDVEDSINAQYYLNQAGNTSIEHFFDPSKHMDTEEHERIIRSLVEKMGAPCAPLLLGKLWKNKSMTQLATELGYSNADSAKAQKAKCMKKLIAFIKPKLIEYGYEYR